MKINNCYNKKDKILFPLFLIAVLFLTILSIHGLLSGKCYFLRTIGDTMSGKLVLVINIFFCLLMFGLLLLFIRSTVLCFSTTTLTETEIIYRSLFKQKTISYNDMRFIALFDVTIPKHKIKGFLFSLDWDLEQYDYTFPYDGFHLKKHYCLIPYSVNVDLYLKYHIPKEKYLDEIITDNTLKKLYHM